MVKMRKLMMIVMKIKVVMISLNWMIVQGYQDQVPGGVRRGFWRNQGADRCKNTFHGWRQDQHVWGGDFHSWKNLISEIWLKSFLFQVHMYIICSCPWLMTSSAFSIGIQMSIHSSSTCFNGILSTCEDGVNLQTNSLDTFQKSRNGKHSAHFTGI